MSVLRVLQYVVLIIAASFHATAQNSSGPTFNDFLRFSCSELNIQRLDP
jgi:hypothetical protein